MTILHKIPVRWNPFRKKDNPPNSGAISYVPIKGGISLTPLGTTKKVSYSSSDDVLIGGAFGGAFLNSLLANSGGNVGDAQQVNTPPVSDTPTVNGLGGGASYPNVENSYSNNTNNLYGSAVGVPTSSGGSGGAPNNIALSGMDTR